MRFAPTPRLLALLVLLHGAISLANGTMNSHATTIASPDGHLRVEFSLGAAGTPRYSVSRDGQPAVLESRLGLKRDDAGFSQGLSLTGQTKPVRVIDEYQILTAKRRQNLYRATRVTFNLATPAGKKMDITFQVSNDGVAFNYCFPETDPQKRRLLSEETSFRFPPHARAWLQPVAEAKTGWEHTNPSYEEYHEQGIPVGVPSPSGAGWAYPALFQNHNLWVLVSESGFSRSYCGTRLRTQSPGGEYSIGFPDPRENFNGGAVNPESTLPWRTPWRVIVVGSLKTIAESTLGIDVAEPPSGPVPLVHQPGKAAWSWPLLQDSKTDYPTQKRFIDYAAEMRWRYCLIDALWDKQIGYDKVKELADYAKTKGVEILVWYNSAGGWNTAPQTPRDMLLTRESRLREFDRLKAMGIAGLKIDFFGGDGQSMMAYYRDILDDAAPYGFLINFHGTTLPRGLQRAYPNLMTAEAIRGLEYITFTQDSADREATHAAMLPFTRNVFDPMDFTPVVFDRLPNVQRKTSSAFELALAVLFTSGLQHYGEIPEGMAKTPGYVREYMQRVPSVWDDTKFMDGFPGKYVALARKGDGRWHIAGINALDTPQAVSLDLEALGHLKKGILIEDGDGANLSFRKKELALEHEKRLTLSIAPRGGFVIEAE